MIGEEDEAATVSQHRGHKKEQRYDTGRKVECTISGGDGFY